MVGHCGGVFALSTITCASPHATIAIHNTRPEVTFEEPVEGEKFKQEEAISFVAFAKDKESSPEDWSWSGPAICTACWETGPHPVRKARPPL